jgi:dipeptidyl-peptidase-4
LAEKTESGWVERRLLESQTLSREGDIPAEELARRERMREVSEGVTAYSTDKDFSLIAYALDGALFLQEIPHDWAAPISEPKRIDAGAGCIDPRLSPDGKHLAFVTAGSLMVVNTDSLLITKQCGPKEDEVNVFWGLADFVAAEELDRVRGYWWTSDSHALYVERVDESPVSTAWISDPANPQKPAHEHRYPFAGSENAIVSLHHVTLTGDHTEVPWNHAKFPYLATVTTSGREPTMSVLSRNQQDLEIFSLHGATPTLLQHRTESPWHSSNAGVPTLSESGQLLEIRPLDNAYRLCADGEPISPEYLQVTGLISSGADITYTAQSTWTNQHIFSVGGGHIFTTATEESLNSGVREGNLLVRAHTDFDHTAATFTLVNLQNPDVVEHTFANNAEVPVITPKVAVETTGEHEIKSAIIWPQDHVQGTRIPVILAPYGGPQHSRVLASGAAFLSDQWLANQGFAVIVTDNRGTPGHGPNFEYSISGDLARIVVQDQVDALIELGSRYPDLDLDRVGIHGWSFGGYLAALAVMERPDIFKVGIAGAPVTDWALYDTAYTERYLGTPGENSDQYQATSLIERAHMLERPLLIIHGLADDNVLVAHSLRLSSALLAAGKTHSVLPLSGVTHMTPQEIVAENLMLAELEFFQEHLQQQ